MINIPENVLYILNKLKQYGYKAYIVGGCVRDYLRGVTPYDWDVTTNALPDEIMKLFDNHNLITNGIKHGTVGVVIDRVVYEITTFRQDGNYTDNRHPDNVEFISDLYGDLRRRDFTINAIAYSPDEGIVDYFGGIADIENGIIKCVGNPDTRFNEDALRIIRAIRFSAVLGYEIESNTKKAMFDSKNLLQNIACERIVIELNKIIICNNYCKILDEYREIMPPMKNIIYTDDFIVRLALLFETSTLKKLRYDNKTIKTVKTIQEIDENINLIKIVTKFGTEIFRYWCDYKYALTSDVKYLESKEIKPIDLQINGQDLIAIGFKNGRNIGDTLDKLLDDIIASKVTNEFRILLEWSKRYMKKLYISDLDGTLLNSDAEISDFTSDTLNELIDNGINFTVATARTAATVLDILRDVKMNLPVILMNGVCIYDIKTNEYIQFFKINKKSCRFLFDKLIEYDLYGFLYSLYNTYYINDDSPHARKFIEERYRKYGKIFTKVDSFYDCINDDLVHFSVSDRKERLIDLYNDLITDSELNIEFYQDIYNTANWYLEVCDKNASKYNAVKFLRNRYNFDKIIGFGDNLNDIPMFKACDYTCAVANAKPDVKSHADEIIDSNTNNGVANWLNRLKS